MVEYAQVIFMLFNDPELLKYYIQTWNVQDLFSTPVLGELRLHRFRRGDFIYREGEPLRDLYLLVRGQVKVFRTFNNGKVSVVEFSSAFDVLGEVELVEARGTTIAVQAMRECDCLGLSMAACREELLRDYTFLAFIARRLGERLGSISNHQSLNASYSVEVRLARYIHFTRRGDMFEERLTEAAEYLGVSYRHLQRIIARFCDEGILERTRRGYRLLKGDYLEDLYKKTL